MNGWIIVRFGGVPSPAFWNSRRSEWATNLATLYKDHEKAENTAFLFATLALSPKLWIGTEGRSHFGACNIEVVATEDANVRWGNVPTEPEEAT